MLLFLLHLLSIEQLQSLLKLPSSHLVLSQQQIDASLQLMHISQLENLAILLSLHRQHLLQIFNVRHMDL